MAFDIYAGTISRYISGDWKTIGQVAAEAAGYQYQVAGRKKPGFLGGFAQKRHLKGWLDQIDSFRAQIGEPGPRWDDSPTRPYWSDRPGWEGFIALQVMSACRLHPDLAVPDDPINLADFDPERFFANVDTQKSPIGSILECELWIPGAFADPVQFRHYLEGEVMMGSLRALSGALDAAADALGVSRSEVEEADRDQPGSDANWMEAARYGLSVFSQGTRFALENRVPLLLDY